MDKIEVRILNCAAVREAEKHAVFALKNRMAKRDCSFPKFFFTII